MKGDIFGGLPDPLNYVIRILIAALCGFIIGFERKTKAKGAGIRTHSIVSLGACLMMIISKYAFWEAEGKYDGARVAAQIVSGIGFLGAGMIVYSKGALHGLTTAAGIWATAGVGMTIGAGGNTMLIVGIAATFIIVGVHVFLHLPIKLFKNKPLHQIQVKFIVQDGALDTIKRIFPCKSVYRLRMNTNPDGSKSATALLRTGDVPSGDQWQKILDEYSFISAIEYYQDEWN